MNSYRSRDQRIADEFTTAHAQCQKCGATVTVESLNNFGAQCGGCFARYCDELNTGREVPRTPKERRAMFASLGASLGGGQTARQVAETLRQRDARGELGPSHAWVLKCCEAKIGGSLRPAADVIA
jgi:hypothetical protein